MIQEIDKPFVSVIVTTYNRQNLIGETLESILNQTYTNFELIIVDDGSTDTTEEIIKNYKDERIIYIKTDNWGGPARPRNIGIKKARGEYIAFCDDDDLWMKEKLEIQLSHFEEKIIGVGSILEYLENGIITTNVRNSENNKYFNYNKILKSGSCVPFSSLIVRNNKYLFDERKDFIATEDFDFQIGITLKTGKYIKQLMQPLIIYRIQPLNISRNVENIENFLNVLDKYNNYVNEFDRKNIVFKRNYGIGKLFLIDSDLISCRKYLVKALKNFVLSKRLVKKACKLFILYFYTFLPQSFRKKLIQRI